MMKAFIFNWLNYEADDIAVGVNVKHMLSLNILSSLAKNSLIS